jgi:hypothetical protein
MGQFWPTQLVKFRLEMQTPYLHVEMEEQLAQNVAASRSGSGGLGTALNLNVKTCPASKRTWSSVL